MATNLRLKLGFDGVLINTHWQEIFAKDQFTQPL